MYGMIYIDPDRAVFIDQIYGNCPVQGEGTVKYKGKEYQFYFRARWCAWSLSIHEEYPLGDHAWNYTEPYGEGAFDAGWIAPHEALAMIIKGVKEFNG